MKQEKTNIRSDTLLIVDDETTQRETLGGYLKKQGFQVLLSQNGAEAIGRIREEAVDLVLTDMRMPEMDGLELLRQIRQINPEIGVIMFTAFGSVEDAVSAMKTGAADYLQKPIDLDQLDLIVKRVLERRRLIGENKRLKETLAARSRFSHLISASPKMDEVLNLAIRAAQSRATVLLRGESGTGKELLAHAIHLASPRKDSPFIAVNLAALSENLIESELFGHEKGAFTGAHQRKAGRFEMADTGTLFIDEVADIPPSAQVKLLRVLQEHRFERVGGSQTLDVDVRMLAATHQDMETMIRSGAFREDLFYRLNVICIRIPPLRERREEIPDLIDHFIRRFSEEEEKPVTGVSREVMSLLMKYDYPGNVRELENVIQRAVVLTRDEVLTLEDLPPQLRGEAARPSETVSDSLTEKIAYMEQKLIREAIQISDGNQSEAARALGISERHLRYKLKKYGLK